MHKFALSLLSGIAAFGLMAGTATAQEMKPPPVAAAPAVMGPDAGCCDKGCDPKGHIIADIGFIIVKPKWKDNPAIFVSNFNDPTTDTHTQIDFNYESQFAPQLSLGYVGASGLGARVSWWGFALGASASFDNGPGNVGIFAADPLQIQETSGQRVGSSGNQQKLLVAGSQLRMDVWDFEAVREISRGQWSALLSAGVRYAHVSQDYNAVTFFSVAPSGNVPAGTVNAAILSGHNFNGAGATVALDGRRLLGQSGAYVYGKGRGSLLVGDSKQTASIFHFFDNGGPDQTDPLMNSIHESENIIPVGELEFGAGFRREIRWGVVFAQVGVLGQAWGSIGNASLSSGDDFEAVSSVNTEGTLGLVGVSMKAGLGW